MKKLIYYIFITANVVGLFGCKKEGIPTYSGENGIYFSNVSDSSVVTFAYHLPNINRVDLSVRVYSLGPVANVDRAFKVTNIEKLTTAQNNVNYSIDTSQFVIKAGEAYTNLKFTLFRLPEMKKTPYVITMELEPNENFTTNYRWDWISLSKKTIRQLMRYTIVFDDMLSQPKTWIPSVYGTFSQKKLYAISEYFEIDLPRWNITSGTGAIPAILVGSYGKVFQNYLNKEKASGNTILDEDGTEMKMGPSSQ
jgi:hypothetical protein